MKSIKKTKTILQTPLIISGFIVIVIAGIITYVLGFGGNFMGWSASSTNQTQTDNNTETTQPDTQNNSVNDDKTPIDNQDDGDSIDSKNTLSASITYVRTSDGQLKIGTVIDSVTSDGACKLTITKGSSIVTDSVDIQPLASSSTCKGFSIPIIELSPGVWSINIDISVGSSKVNLTNSYTVE